MWIALPVREPMMNAVGGHPEDGSAFEGRRTSENTPPTWESGNRGGLAAGDSPIPIPRLPDIHQRTIATKRAFQVKKSNAAIAPMWKAAMKKVVTQLMSLLLANFCVGGS
jgi:hypothetical protein